MVIEFCAKLKLLIRNCSARETLTAAAQFTYALNGLFLLRNLQLTHALIPSNIKLKRRFFSREELEVQTNRLIPTLCKLMSDPNVEVRALSIPIKA